MLLRKSLKTGWTAWFPNQKKKKKQEKKKEKKRKCACNECGLPRKGGPAVLQEQLIDKHAAGPWVPSCSPQSAYLYVCQYPHRTCKRLIALMLWPGNLAWGQGIRWLTLTRFQPPSSQCSQQSKCCCCREQAAATGMHVATINKGWSMEFFPFLSHVPFPSSHSMAVDSSRSGALQEARPRVGMYVLLYCSGHFILVKESHLNTAAPLLIRDRKALLNLA